jgi:chorismate dehydratase
MTLAAERAPLTVGRIEFLNALPFFAETGDEKNRTAYVRGFPTDINRGMRAGEIDIGLTSSLLCASMPDELMVFPDLCIASYEKSMSVALFSSEPLERLRGKKIALSSKSLSAASLLRILFRHYWRLPCEFEISSAPLEEMQHVYAAFLAIGDEALFFEAPGMQVYDLSRVWWQWTGYPFCFALWTVRRAVYESSPEAVRAFFESLRARLKGNLAHLEELVGKAGPAVLVRRDKALQYLRSLEYRLNPRVREGLSLFFEHARRLGLVAGDGNLSFCEFS